VSDLPDPTEPASTELAALRAAIKALNRQVTVLNIAGHGASEALLATSLKVESADTEAAILRARLETAEAALHGGAWPVHECLRVLADAADHLLLDHNCDDTGYECVMQARDAARKHVEALTMQSAPGVVANTEEPQ
jgi:hypothetical protein